MPDFDDLASREWLVTNGIGGFASGTLAGCATRRYHGLLIAALDPPAGRMTLLGTIDATVTTADGTAIALATHRYTDGTIFPDGWKTVEPKASQPLVYRLPDGRAVERWVEMVPGQNATVVTYTLSRPGDTLTLAPLVCWKDSHALMRRWNGFPHRSEPFDTDTWLVQPTSDSPTLYLQVIGGVWKPASWWNENLALSIEAERGFASLEEQFCPATVTAHSQRVTLVASLDAPRVSGVVPAEPERLRAADPFVVHGGGRATILAGYPWFTDWGRDTFISLPGLCLSTGRLEIAREILLGYARWVNDGRIPNRFPDHPDRDPPAYNNIDGTLWFVRACGQYLAASGDDDFQATIQPTLDTIVAAHRSGTVGDGIGVDPADGLLRGGTSATNLTWMDAKVGGRPITPRAGKPVEVNALWIHALRVAGHTADADTAQAAFLTAFVRSDGLGLYDRIDAAAVPDASIRPNQAIAAAVLDLPDRVNRAVLDTATTHLLTPYGLRTLSPIDPAYRARYEGDGGARDSAYHQGTVWPWLIGSYIDLFRKVHGEGAGIGPLVAPLWAHFEHEYGQFGIAEVFDAEPPHRPNGCPWQAWSLAELQRVSR
jgi:glycogen debranching enzyme